VTGGAVSAFEAAAGRAAVALGPTQLRVLADRIASGAPDEAVRGSVPVPGFAASWCGPCRYTLPRLEAYAREHPEIDVLVVSVDEKVEGRDQLVRSLGLESPVLWDEGHAIARHFEPEALPTTVVLDTEGDEIYRYLGSSERGWEELVAFLESRRRSADS